MTYDFGVQSIRRLRNLCENLHSQARSNSPSIKYRKSDLFISGARFEPLTERERELLTYLALHYHLREIASRVYLSHNTVKTHTKAIYRKLGAASRAEAVAIARARGIL